VRWLASVERRSIVSGCVGVSSRDCSTHQHHAAALSACNANRTRIHHTKFSI
jgi:hypothetical protein